MKTREQKQSTFNSTDLPAGVAGGGQSSSFEPRGWFFILPPGGLYLSSGYDGQLFPLASGLKFLPIPSDSLSLLLASGECWQSLSLVSSWQSLSDGYFLFLAADGLSLPLTSDGQCPPLESSWQSLSGGYFLFLASYGFSLLLASLGFWQSFALASSWQSFSEGYFLFLGSVGLFLILGSGLVGALFLLPH